ncbi:MAG TPA: DUF1641 domain-containing protein [Terracidiphilus sp.]|jgi:uncharacterized protein YjgD (DUF1641 family)
MARAIGLEVAPRDPREELRKRLEAAPDAHAEALLEGYELLQELHDAGILRVLRGAVSAGDKLIETAVDAAKSEEAIRAQRNAMILGKMLGSIDPEVLHSFANAVNRTLGNLTPVEKPPGFLGLIGAFFRPEQRRSMALINRFLETLGYELKTRGESR